MRSHLKVYFSFEEDTNALNDGERGRLLLAMVRYAKDGTEITLTGNERFLFPVFKAQIDRDIETYNTKVTNGSKGGRPKTEDNSEEPNKTENNLKEPDETENNLNAKIEDRRYKIEDKRLKDNNIIKPQKRFTPPTVEEIKAYCEERGKYLIDPQYFVDYYEARGWMLTKNRKMVDWKATVRTWEKNERDRAKEKVIDDLPY